jgi:hypothetical protein
MKPNIAKRVIKPERCVLAFGIPLSEGDFKRDLDRNDENFAKHFDREWTRYFEEVVHYFEMIRPRLIELGVTVRPRLTLDDFGALFKEQFEVIILFSHWDKKLNAVEFYDGFVPYHAIIERVPVDFDRILDLSVCHPDPLVDALEVGRPQCLIRRAKRGKKVIPRDWLYFFLALFTHLKDQDLTYIQAVEDVITAALEIIERR